MFFLLSYIDHTSLFSSREKEVYDNLVRVVGSEMDIRIRQNIFLITDKIYNKVTPNIIRVSSGSLAEGLDLPGSDMDIMLVLQCVQIIQNVQYMNRSARGTTLLMEDDMEFPGFSRLKLIAESDHEYTFTSPECFVETINGLFLSNISFISFTRKVIQVNNNSKNFVHGPCLSNEIETVDLAFCFHLHTWPRQAEQWIYRHKHGQWPTNILINEIVNYGCILVPIGPKEIDNNELLWRISFSVAEKQLSHSMNYTQILCYALLKLSLKNIINRNDKVKGLLCSYFMKTAVFWLSEEIFTNTFKLQNLLHCYFLCLDKIIAWVKCCYCPNYFIPEHNMFRGKLNRANSWLLINVLERLRNGEREALTVNTLFNSETVLHASCVKLEMFWYTTIKYISILEIETGYTLLSFIKSLAMSHSSSILSGICKYYYAMISQNIVQKLPFPTTNIRYAHVIQRYHKHLHDGTKSDAVTGWLLYASFYYALGQYNTTLKIIDHVLSRCTPDMIMLNKSNYTTDDIKHYIQNVGCSKITLNEKMRLATIYTVEYFKQSTLIPHELRPEVQNGLFRVPPVVMSHCLRFLCYHHLYSIANRQQSFRDLYLTIKEMYYIGNRTLSNSLTMLGVCYEIVGDKGSAYCCYDSALQNEYDVCLTAAKRKVDLNMT
jgi:hypothetical protein